jgi:anti-sigma factor RsiW
MHTGEGTEVFIAYGAQALPPELELAFSEHLKDCEACRRAAEAQKEVWNALDAWEAQPVSSNFDARLYERIAREAEPPWWHAFRFRWTIRPALPLAAVFAALLVAFVLRDTPAEQRSAVTQPDSIDIEKVEQALDDLSMLSQLRVVSPRPTNLTLSGSL